MSDRQTPSAPTCGTCGNPAACIGAYEGSQEEAFACDECCGHGNEDGHCVQLDDKEAVADLLLRLLFRKGHV